MKRVLFTIVCLSFFFHSLHAQKENNHWVAGVLVKIDFNTPVPTVMPGQMILEGGCAMSNRHTGALMFYSNGITVWDANDNIMPNGNGLIGGTTSGQNSTTQGALIVPFIDDTAKFYIFTLQGQDYPNETAGALHYSVVDMTLNGGLGDVVAGQKNIFVHDSLCEALVAVRGAGCNVWVLTHERVNNTYKAFEVTAQGVNTTPVVSALPNILYFSQPGQSGAPFNFSNIKSAPDGSKVCMVSQGYGILCNFDNVSGEVIDQLTLDSNVLSNNSAVYWSCFSPGSNNLYLSKGGPGHALYQYNVASGNPANILSSKTLIDTARWEDLQIVGEKIYAAQLTPGQGLGKINAPDVAGIGCNFDPTLLPFNGGAISSTSQNYVVYPNSGIIPNSKDTAGCSTNMHLGGRPNALSYLWNNGAIIQSITITAPGTYWVVSEFSCNTRVDTFHVTHQLDTITSSADSIICNGAAITLSGRTGAISYQWNNNSTLQQQAANTIAQYWVRSVFDCDLYIDTFNVSALNVYVGLGDDTILCNGEWVTLSANLNGVTYQWQDGSTAQTYTTNAAGAYSLTVSKEGCTASDTVNIDVQSVSVVLGDRTICPEDSLVLDISQPNATYLWQDGDTSSIYIATQPGNYQATVTINGCSSTDNFSLEHHLFPKAGIITEQGPYCLNEQVTLRVQELPNYTYLWQDGTVGPLLVVNREGLYIVAISNSCVTYKDSITILYKQCDCIDYMPNGFTPNNDRKNDKIGVRIDCPATEFEFAIYNRWGNMVFSTTDPAIKWDGMYKGEPCDIGTYGYYYQFVSPRGDEIKKKGMIHLLR